MALGVRVSIHAPVKGATSNPRASMYGKRVSIHAPVKGATPDLPLLWWRALSFNPRPREGGDNGPEMHFIGTTEFQSTPP